MRGTGKRSHKNDFHPVLSSVGFYNLKAFGDWETLPIRRLNLIFGRNSSGKSSIFHSLLWIRDVLFNKNLNITTPERSGDFVDLGGLEQFVHFKKKKEKKIGFRLTVNVPLKEILKDTEKKVRLSHKDPKETRALRERRREELLGFFQAICPSCEKIPITLEVLFDLNKALDKNKNRFGPIHVAPDITLSAGGKWLAIFTAKKKTTKVDPLFSAPKDASSYQKCASQAALSLLQPFSGIALKAFKIQHIKIAARSVARQFASPHYDVVLHGLFSERGLQIFPGSGERGEIRKEAREIQRLSDEMQGVDLFANDFRALVEACSFYVHLAARRFFIDPNYLAAYRNYPEREISERGLLKARGLDPYGNQSYRDIFENQEFLHRINRACELLQADFRFVLDKKTTKTTGLRLEIKNLHSGLNLSFRDIGFGWSQVLPVIVEIVQGMHSALFVEQPELHLHPNNQSQLMDVVLENLGQYESAPPVFLELHSEQMVLRLLRRIKEGGKSIGHKKVKPEDVVISYVVKEKEGSKIRRLAISDHGTMGDPWPGGFFESALKDF